jgi:chromosome segregation ATPase
MERQGIEVEDLRAALRTRSEEIKGLQADLQQMAQVATAGAQDDTLALVAAQGKAAKATGRVAELEDQLEELRGNLKELELECRDLREARDARAADEVDSRALRRQVAQLTQELETIQWREHQMHGESARIKVQLDSALAEIGELRARGSAGQESERGQYEAERARLEERIAELEREVSHLRSGRVDDEEVARLREELVGARAESEIAWSEVEHLREKLGGNE